jgi:serine/threonine protein kinase
MALVGGALRGAALVDADAHLDACRSCRLLVSAYAAQTGERRSVVNDLCAFTHGDLLAGRYRIEALIGAGGMGEVYEALDTVLGERIALKTIAISSELDDEGIARFKAEVQMARRVTHPNVCRVFDVGFHEEPAYESAHERSAPIPFLTMELLRGETLRTRLKRSGALSPPDALALLDQVGEGLEAAHRASVIHADLKSENVMLIGAGAGARVVITDFGLARQADERSLRLPADGAAIAGTMGYMSPEQLAGQPAGPASDVYAMGIMLFEMVTGRLPYGVPTIVAMEPREWGPPPLLRELNGDVPPGWQAVVARCLAQAPEARFPHARDVIEGLRRALPRRWPSTRRRLLAAFSVAGVLSVAALALRAWPGREPTRASQPAATYPPPPPRLVSPRASAIVAPGPLKEMSAPPSPSSEGSRTVAKRRRAPPRDRGPQPSPRVDRAPAPSDQDPGKDEAIDPFAAGQ